MNPKVKKNGINKNNWEMQVKFEAIAHLSELIILVNLTVFVFSGLVKGFQYYFPVIALVLAGSVAIFIIAPFTKLFGKKTYWLMFLAILLSIYFTFASLVYFVQHGDFSKMSPANQ